MSKEGNNYIDEYVHWLRELDACYSMIVGDYFSSGLKHLKRHLID